MLSRRRFLQVVGSGAALAVMPACGDNITIPPRGVFFDEHAWATIDAAAETLLPGARAAMAVRYIDGLLSAFASSPPRIFGGGPFSGRTAVPDEHGAPTAEIPANAFASSLPLTRVQELAWRIRIYGSAETAGGDFNDAVLGPTVGYRALYTGGFAALDAAAAPKTFATLADAARADAIATLSTTPFYQTLLGHVIEGTFAAPEYGGNADLAGWQLARFDGDSAPLGHAYFDPTANAYVDRADQPTSTATPGEGPETFDDGTLDLLTFISTGSGGMRFF